MTFEDKTLYDWLKFLDSTDPVLTAKFTNEEFEKICTLLRKWDSDRLAAKAIEGIKNDPTMHELYDVWKGPR